MVQSTVHFSALFPILTSNSQALEIVVFAYRNELVSSDMIFDNDEPLRYESLDFYKATSFSDSRRYRSYMATCPQYDNADTYRLCFCLLFSAVMCDMGFSQESSFVRAYERSRTKKIQSYFFCNWRFATYVQTAFGTGNGYCSSKTAK